MESLVCASEMIQKDKDSIINTSLNVAESYLEDQSCNEADLHLRDNDDSERSSEDPSSASDDQDLDEDSNDLKYCVTAGNSPLSVVIKRCVSGASRSEDSCSNKFEAVCKSPVSSTEYPTVENSQQLKFAGLCGVGSENDEAASNQVTIGSKSSTEIFLGSQPIKDEETGGEQHDDFHNVENTNCATCVLSPKEELGPVGYNLDQSNCGLTVQVDSLGRLPSESEDQIEESITVTSTLVNEEHASLSKVNECSSEPSGNPVQSIVSLQLETSHTFFEKNGITSQEDNIIYSPLLFSEDDEDDAENSSYYCPPVQNISRCNNDHGSRTTEERRLKQLRLSMIGVPPPASVTNPQLSLDDLLRLLKENETLMSWPGATTEKQELLRKFQEQAEECAWPDSASFCYPDMYYNNSLESEQFAALSQKYAQRYVGAETACICNKTGLTGSATKRNRKLGAGFSPGRRLSHLARRRKAFSRDNLLSNSTGGLPKSQPNALAERRQILVGTKTKFDRSRPGTSKAGLSLTAQSLGPRVLTHKRALFQSPDEGKKNASAKKSQSGSKRRNNLLKAGVQSFKRALFASASKEKEVPEVKRPRSDSHPVASSSKRKLLFGNEEVSGGTSSPLIALNSKENLNGMINPGSSSTIKCNSKSALLNSGHKKKLLWAVAESLRKQGVNMSHMLFRPCASSLARICRSLLPNLQQYSGSTSEMMLQIADQHASDIIRAKQAEAQTS